MFEVGCRGGVETYRAIRDHYIAAREMMVKNFCDFCHKSQKPTNAKRHLCQITIYGCTNNLDSSVRLLQNLQCGAAWSGGKTSAW